MVDCEDYGGASPRTRPLASPVVPRECKDGTVRLRENLVTWGLESESAIPTPGILPERRLQATPPGLRQSPALQTFPVQCRGRHGRSFELATEHALLGVWVDVVMGRAEVRMGVLRPRLSLNLMKSAWTVLSRTATDDHLTRLLSLPGKISPSPTSRYYLVSHTQIPSLTVLRRLPLRV